jgi:hypothetical protein
MDLVRPLAFMVDGFEVGVGDNGRLLLAGGDPARPDDRTPGKAGAGIARATRRPTMNGCAAGSMTAWPGGSARSMQRRCNTAYLSL